MSLMTSSAMLSIVNDERKIENFDWKSDKDGNRRTETNIRPCQHFGRRAADLVTCWKRSISPLTDSH